MASGNPYSHFHPHFPPTLPRHIGTENAQIEKVPSRFSSLPSNRTITVIIIMGGIPPSCWIWMWDRVKVWASYRSVEPRSDAGLQFMKKFSFPYLCRTELSPGKFSRSGSFPSGLSESFGQVWCASIRAGAAKVDPSGIDWLKAHKVPAGSW